MSDAYVGEIRMFAGNFAPLGWAFCDGQLLSISENSTLFSLIGTTYGGDGETTFALPDLRGRIPLHAGTNPTTGTAYPLGQKGGVETVTLTVDQLPAHTHQVAAQSQEVAEKSTVSGAVWAPSSVQQYSTSGPTGTMSASAVATAGGSQPHDNMMPAQCISFIISLWGIYPSPN
ncbi:tail fiber protein [Brevibacillus humidisoli]|uniref:phage tail protein n=1 Tax=Brevibacillus humidisoli TaxID=2895522 RepID=UPI001E45434D|nr:tail fiber protein [Brevibacillus humidisoli]UFJ39582.1 tail fiber protein [Brevibacillus humidisoli]